MAHDQPVNIQRSAHAGEIEPPGAHEHAHHGHVIVPMRVLLMTLSILLFFTVLTVGLAQAEHWLAHTLHLDIPQWVNVAIALSIAGVKTFFVAAYFMQLRYDSPVNTMVLVFTIITVVLFLGFTMIDLGNRDTLYAYKGEYVHDGGSGGVRSVYDKEKDNEGVETGRWVKVRKDLGKGVSVAEDVRSEAIAKIKETIASGGSFTPSPAMEGFQVRALNRYRKYEHHMREQILELTGEHHPLPEHLADYQKFLLDTAAAAGKSGKLAHESVREFVHELHELHTRLAEENRPTPDRARVRRDAPGEHAPEPGHDQPAHEHKAALAN